VFENRQFGRGVILLSKVKHLFRKEKSRNDLKSIKEDSSSERR
jgi:hypothetical protein